jgi:hypothetical protein
MLATGLILAVSLTATAGTPGAASDKPAKITRSHTEKKFESVADQALAAMRKRAEELKIGGVAVVSYAEGDTVQGWSSKMAVVGHMKDAPTADSKGNNLLGIAYAKAAEMADTLQNSGAAKRPPMTGEFGWQGGVVAKSKTGYIIVAFSGGKSEDDVQVSQAGLAVLKNAL